MLYTTGDRLEKLHMNRLYRPREMDRLETIYSVLSIMQLMPSDLHNEYTSFPIFQQTALQAATSKHVKMVAAVLSLA